MTRYKPDPTSVSIREIARWWPLLIVVTLIAVGGAIWSVSRQVASYTATTTVVVAPLPQYDETFLGISLLRDSGDAALTTATTAAVLSSRRAATLAADYLGSGWTPDSVAAAVKVSPRGDANVIEVVAKAPEPDQAAKLAEGYAKATLNNQWQTISAELDARITAITKSIAASPDNPNVEAQYQLLQTLQLARAGGSDPTMKIDSTSAPVRSEQLSTGMTVALAAAGGLCVGLLASVGAAMLRRRMGQSVEASTDRVPTPVHSPDDGL